VNTVRAIVTSDNHLNRYYDRMPPHKLAERRRRLRLGFQLAVEAALERKVDLFIQAGDLFDTPDPRNAERVFVAGELDRLRRAGVLTFAIAGNHDTPKQRLEQGGSLPQSVYASLGGLRLLDGPDLPTETVELHGLRVAIGAQPWSPMLTADQDPLQNARWSPDADVRIFLFHRAIEGHLPPGANEPIVKRASLAGLGSAELVVAGHVHQHTVERIGPLTVLVPGATEQMTFGERGEPGFWLVELSDGGVERLEHLTVPCQPRRQLHLRPLDLVDEGDDLCANLLRRIEPECQADLLLRLHLEGPITREGYRALDLRRLHQIAAERTFSFDVSTAELYVQDELGQRPTGGVRISQREELTACTDELLAATDDPVERELLEATRRALLSYYEGGAEA
jgi:DNA repair exonuclease SbcCD nuclease subunit